MVVKRIYSIWSISIHYFLVCVLPLGGYHISNTPQKMVGWWTQLQTPIECHPEQEHTQFHKLYLGMVECFVYFILQVHSIFYCQPDIKSNHNQSHVHLSELSCVFQFPLSYCSYCKHGAVRKYVQCVAQQTLHVAGLSAPSDLFGRNLI